MAVIIQEFKGQGNIREKHQRCLLALLLLFIAKANAQDLDGIGKGDIFTAGGGLSLSQVYYQTNAPVPSRKPYTYLLNGNLNLKFLGFIDAPFLFFYSNLGSGFTQPTFNQTSIHPKYKWIQTHFGNLSASWSPHTLNGHMFTGAAVDLSPGNWQIGAVYGRFVKATRVSGNSNGTLEANALQRRGAGFKANWNHGQKGNFGANIFYASDETSNPEFHFNGIFPKSNLAFGLMGEWNLVKKVRVRAENSWSVLTNNSLLAVENNSPKFVATLVPYNASTSVFRATKIATDWQFKPLQIKLGYERIDPGYQSLGAYYFNNDLENITIGLTTSFFKSKLRVLGNIGKQRDNLNGAKLSMMRRTVGNVSIQFQASKKLHMQCNYSNFLSYSNLRSFAEQQSTASSYQSWDTLNFRQISQNINWTVQWIFISDTLRQAFLTTCLNAQNTAERSNNELRNGALFLNVLMSLGQTWVRSGTTLSFSLNASKSPMESADIVNCAAAVNAGTNLFHKKLRGTLSASLVQVYSNRRLSANIFTLRNQWNCTFSKVHQLGLSVVFLRRPLNSAYFPTRQILDNTITLNYSVNTIFFDFKDRKGG